MLGKTIARLRKSKGLTQAKFADMIHVTQGAISQWETGRTNPDVQQMFILADFFGITVEELTSGVFKTEQPIVSTPAQEKAPANGMSDEQMMAKLRAMSVNELHNVMAKILEITMEKRNE